MNIRFFVAGLMGSFVSFATIANEVTDKMLTDNTWYVGVDVGKSGYNANDRLVYANDDTEFAAGVHLGYQFSDYFATELAYQYLADSEITIDEGEAISADFQQGVLAGKLSYPITDRFYPYIKVGAAYWYGEVNKLETNGTALVLGAGLAYAISDNLQLRTEYQYTDALSDDLIPQGLNNNLTTFGLSYRFGDKPTPAPYIEPAPTPTVPPVVEPITLIEQQTYVRQIVLFESDSIQVTNPHLMDVVVDAMKQDEKATAIVKGHTDSSGSDAYNQKLSQRRAQAVKDILMASDIEALGELSPASDNSSTEGKALNRRVEIIVE